jgi:hypothetical protein
MTAADAEAMLQSVADRQAISQMLYNYCRAMDRCDTELGYSVWHEDGEADYGMHFRGSGRGFVDFALEAHHRLMLAHSHQVANIIIALHGDRAESESYVKVALRQRMDGRLMEVTAHGRYLDRWSRRAGRWAIDKRVYLQDLDEVREVTGYTGESWGRRDRDDPSYLLFSDP